MQKGPNFDKNSSNSDLKDVVVENLSEIPVRNNTPSTSQNSEFVLTNHPEKLTYKDKMTPFDARKNDFSYNFPCSDKNQRDLCETPGQKTDFSSHNQDLKSAENPPNSAVNKCVS